MRRLAVSWTAAVPLAALEAALVRSWLWGLRYVARYGREENPYAAEDADIAGVCALLLLPLVLAAAGWAAYCTVMWCKSLFKIRRNAGLGQIFLLGKAI